MKPHGHWPRLTIRQVNRLLADNVMSVQDLCRYCYALGVAGEQVWKLQAFASLVSLDEIMEKARQADDRRRKRGALLLSPLDGIPFSVKTNLAVASQPLTAGSRILGAAAAGSPSTEDITTTTAGYTADVVWDLEKSGAILMGVTSMDEFGMGSLGTNQPTTPTKNPLPFLHTLQTRLSVNNSAGMNDVEQIKQILQSSMDDILEMHQQIFNQAEQDASNNSNDSSSLYYSAGGSSCGSAASVAHGSSLISLGSDTGGSVRLPASWCGIVGLKPTYGRLSRHGLVSYASSLDTVGLLARSADCAALAFQQLVKPTSSSSSSSSSTAAANDKQHRRIVDSTLSSRQAEFVVRTDILPDSDTNDNYISNEKDMVLKGLRIGLPEAFSVEECPIAIRKAWSQSAQLLQAHGATVEIVPAHVISPSVLKNLLAAYYVLVCAEASSNLARYDGFRFGVGADTTELDTILNEYCQAREGKGIDDNALADLTLLEWQYAAARTRGFGPEVKRRILCGTAVLSSDRFHTYYEAAAKLRAVATQQLHSCLGPSHGNQWEGKGDAKSEKCYYDMLLVPTTLYPPPRLDGANGGNGGKMDSTEMFANDIMTVPASLAGLPAVSVPFGDSIIMNDKDNDSQSSPTSSCFRPGMQLIGAKQQEDRILQVAALLESQRRA